MTGSDVAPLGKDSVNEINKLFDWAEKSPKGMILFIDEAESFLRQRVGDEGMSENLWQSICAFLAWTGSPSYNVIVVLASNVPKQLDYAVIDWVDEVVNFEKPGVKERKNMLFHYLVQFCKPPESSFEWLSFFWKFPKSIITGKKLIWMEGISNDLIESFAN